MTSAEAKVYHLLAGPVYGFAADAFEAGFGGDNAKLFLNTCSIPSAAQSVAFANVEEAGMC